MQFVYWHANVPIYGNRMITKEHNIDLMLTKLKEDPQIFSD